MNLGDVGEMNVPPTQDLGAREHAFESQDLSLLWVLERLAIESDEKLLGLFDAVMSTPMRDMVESPMFEPVKCRFVLRRLVRTVEVNDEQNCGLDYLNRLADDDPVRYGALKPPTDLLVQVKKFLISKIWRDESTPFHVGDVIQAIHRYFDSEMFGDIANEIVDQCRDFDYRNSVTESLNEGIIIDGIIRFANAASHNMGPTLLEILAEEYNAGQLRVGQGNVPSNVVKTTASKGAHDLEAATYDLRHAGGTDPFEQAYESGSLAQQQNDVGMDGQGIQGLHPKDLHNSMPEPDQPRRLSVGDIAALLQQLSKDKENYKPPSHRKRGDGHLGYNKWTDLETKELIDLVSTYGYSWGKISDHDRRHNNILVSRNNVQLKDRWRNLTKRDPVTGELVGRFAEECKVVESMHGVYGFHSNSRRMSLSSPVSGLVRTRLSDASRDLEYEEQARKTKRSRQRQLEDDGNSQTETEEEAQDEDERQPAKLTPRVTRSRAAKSKPENSKRPLRKKTKK